MNTIENLKILDLWPGGSFSWHKRRNPNLHAPPILIPSIWLLAGRLSSGSPASCYSVDINSCLSSSCWAHPFQKDHFASVATPPPSKGVASNLKGTRFVPYLCGIVINMTWKCLEVNQTNCFCTSVCAPVWLCLYSRKPKKQKVAEKYRLLFSLSDYLSGLISTSCPSTFLCSLMTLI